MAIFENLFNRKPKVVVGHTETEIKKAINYINLPTINFNVDDGRKLSAIIICSKIIAQDISRLPIKLFKTDNDGNKTILKDDPRYLMLHNHPNKYTDSFSFWNTVEFVRSTEGNAYVRINKENGYPVSLEIIPNEKIGRNVVVDGELWYEYTDKHKTTEIHYMDILHFRNLSKDGRDGRDPKDDLNLNLSISYKALTTLDNFYNNGAITAKALETIVPEGVNPQEWITALDEFDEKYEGYLNAHKTVKVPPFTKLVNIGTNFADAQLIDTIKYNNGQVASYYGIPPHKLGVLENSKFNSLYELQNDYVHNTIAPILMMYRREFEMKLLTDTEILDGYSIEAETGALLITDSKTRIQNYKDLFGMGAMTRKKIAHLENLPFEGDDDYFIATGYMGIDKAKGTIPKEESKLIKKDVSTN